MVSKFQLKIKWNEKLEYFFILSKIFWYLSIYFFEFFKWSEKMTLDFWYYDDEKKYFIFLTTLIPSRFFFFLSLYQYYYSIMSSFRAIMR